MGFLSSAVRVIYRHRILLYQTVKQEFRKRYAGSVFGLSWFIVQPLLLLSVYAIVYIAIFKVKFAMFSSNEYVLMILCGLIPFLGFSDALTSGTGSVTSNSSLIKNTLFPIEIVPVRAVLVAHGAQVVALILLLALTAIVRGLHPVALLLPILVILQIMFLCGLVWILSALNVFFRDLQQIITTIVMLLMMISPIAYTIEMVPEAMVPLIASNPIAHFIFCYQSIVFLGELPPLLSVKLIAIVSPIMFLVGHHFFIRLKRVMVDYV